jgi:hypothetical protein
MSDYGCCAICKNITGYLRDDGSLLCDMCWEKTRMGRLEGQLSDLLVRAEKLERYKRNARRSYRSLQIAYERLRGELLSRDRAPVNPFVEAAQEFTRQTRNFCEAGGRMVMGPAELEPEEDPEK